MKSAGSYGNLSLIVMTLLNERDMYGYEICELIMDKSKNIIDIKAGTLYPLLKSLETKKLVFSYEKLSLNGKKRKYYQITPSGGLYLEKTRDEWLSYSKIINSIVTGGILP